MLPHHELPTFNSNPTYSGQVGCHGKVNTKIYISALHKGFHFRRTRFTTIPFREIHITVLCVFIPNVHVLCQEVTHFLRLIECDFQFRTYRLHTFRVCSYDRVSFRPISFILYIIVFVEFVYRYEDIVILRFGFRVQDIRGIVIHFKARRVQIKPCGSDIHKQW